MKKIITLLVTCFLTPYVVSDTEVKRQANPQQQTYVPTYAPYPTQIYSPQNERYTPGRFFRILRQEQDVSPDGRYHYIYETENGIFAEESGALRGTGDGGGTAAQGSYRYTSPEGLLIEVQYTADENGFRPSGTLITAVNPRTL